MKCSMLGLVMVGLLVTGCSSKSYCLGNQRYYKAESIKPLVAGQGLTLPQSATALNVPPPPPNEAPYGVVLTAAQRRANDNRAVQCLDQPPPLPVQRTTLDAAPPSS